MHALPSPSPLRALVALFALLCIAAPSAAAMEGHHDHVAPPPPAPGDPRFMAGTVGPVVFRGTAATVTIPDGPGFGGEKGRTQNSGDLRKNNYSVTDANFNNVLGLLPRHPDTGAELTYVQHIQLYAAAGFIETYAPATYAHLVMHQGRGEGTVLGGAGYLMGLVRTFDPAAHGVSADAIPATLPGTTIASRNYVRATRDATGQQWARPHHAQTAPAVYRMLLEAGLPASAALVLASDDGISGAGRINGMNEQDGAKDGFNSGERATWAFAAQLQQQTGVPVVLHMMGGHDHTGLDDSARTKPKANAIIGFATTDRAATPERAAALYEALRDGRIATAETAAADQKLTVRDEAYLRPRSALDVDVDASFDWKQEVGTEQTIAVTVENHGPHFVRDVQLRLTTSPNLHVVGVAAPAGVHCTVTTCQVGDLSAAMDSRRDFVVTVRFVAPGRTSFDATVASASDVATAQLHEHREHGAHGRTVATVAMAALRRGVRASACGATMRRTCVVRRAVGTNLVVGARPARYADKQPRSVKVVFQQRVGRRWHTRGDDWVRLAPSGLARVRVKPKRLPARGAWRVRVEAGSHHMLHGATSGWRYLTVR